MQARSFSSDFQRRVGKENQAAAKEISSYYAGKDLLLIGVLKGSLCFGRSHKTPGMPCGRGFHGHLKLRASTESSEEVRITKDLEESVAGCHFIG